MSNDNAHGVLCKALALAAILGVGGFLYFLWAAGVPRGGLAVAGGMTLFISALTVAGTVIALRNKEE